MKTSDDTLLPTFSVWQSPPLQILYRVVVLSPWVWLLLFGAFVLVTTLQVGHLPTYGLPDPKYAGLASLFYLPTMLLLIWVIGTTPVGIALITIRVWKDFPHSVGRREAIFYLGGMGLFYLFVLSDVAGLMTWLAD